MVSLEKSVLILAALAAFVSSGNALKCYVCNSAYDEKCADPFNPESIPTDDCRFSYVPRFLRNLLKNANATGCMKAVNEVDGNKQFIRSCFFGDIQSTSIGCKPDPALPNVKQISCDICTDDYCNEFSA